MSYTLNKSNYQDVRIIVEHLISPLQQKTFRNYHDKKSIVKKRAYHYFVKEQLSESETFPILSDKERSVLWKNVTFDVFISYLHRTLQYPQTILTRRGFEMYKPHYDDVFLQQIRKELTVTPYAPKGYGPPPTSHDVFMETDELLIVPRYYGVKNLPEVFAIPNLISRGYEIDVPFAGALREKQERVVDVFRKRFVEEGGGLVVARCAFGKTAVGNYMISMLKRKTLVIVHKVNLLLQWEEAIEKFLPSARIGRIQGSTIDVEGKDVVIGMIQSLYRKDYGSLFEQFGFVISDEVHRTAAKAFCKALRKTSCCYTLGLTATPNRPDGMTKVFKWYLGDIGYTYDHVIELPVTVEFVYYKSILYRESKLYSGGYNFGAMLKQIIEETERTQIIVSMAVKYASIGRRILVISRRLGLLRSVCKYLNRDHPDVTHGFFTGGMKAVDREHTKTRQIILGSYGMIEEGADIPVLDTIILATPKSDVQQAVGRIMRQKNKHDPLIIDIVDEFSIFPRQAQKRNTYYKKEQYKVTGYKQV
jgi:superfamily II DNA or RNA helicase